MPRMIRRAGVRRKPETTDQAKFFSQSSSLLSVDGQLRSLYYKPGETEERSQDYTPLDIGKPIVARYLYHFLKLPGAGNKHQEIMVSTFLKTDEEKKPAAEAINFYDPKFRFNKSIAELENYGADTYGHELIYYSKSYTGEPIKLTTKIMELDNPQRSIKSIVGGIERIGELPFFAEYLPYVAIAKTGGSLLGNIFRILNRDDPIVPGLRLDLFHNRPNAHRLQSGRIVSIQGVSEEDILNQGYTLNEKNRLIGTNGKPYIATPYFVMQINSETQPAYNDFEYFQNAAELLALTNRPEGLSNFIETAVQGFATYADIATIGDMEEIRDDLDDPETKQRFKALFKGLSSEMKGLYREKYKEMLEES